MGDALAQQIGDGGGLGGIGHARSMAAEPPRCQIMKSFLYPVRSRIRDSSNRPPLPGQQESKRLHEET
jgi:hypothetical protein